MLKAYFLVVTTITGWELCSVGKRGSCVMQPYSLYEATYVSFEDEPCVSKGWGLETCWLWVHYEVGFT